MLRFGNMCALAATLALGCGDAASAPDAAASDAGSSDAGSTDAPAPSADAATTPMTLRQTGLYADGDGQVLADGVRAYEPLGQLWSDGATKRRFVQLPTGATIDTTDMNFWQFPVGTKLWKEFARDGVRVETRLLYKTGEGEYGWWMMAYAWNEAQTEAVAAPFGGVDVLRTGHDIPSQSLCEKCHVRGPDVGLGFSAVQLAHDGDGVTLSDLIAEGALSDPPVGLPVIPGDATARTALTYLHANCGNCHNARSDVLDKTSLSMWLEVGELSSVEVTDTYATSVGAAPQLDLGEAIIAPGNPAVSAVHLRMDSREAEIGMPPLASEQVDVVGLGLVDAWIRSLGPSARGGVE